MQNSKEHTWKVCVLLYSTAFHFLLAGGRITVKISINLAFHILVLNL